MRVGAAHLWQRMLSHLPWRLRSRNNFMMASANWYFNKVRLTPPRRVTVNAPLELHALVCHRDVNMMLTCAKSLIRYLPEASLVLHDDGSTTDEDRHLFEHHLPGVWFITRAESDAAMKLALPAEVFEKRQSYFFLLKLFDVNYFNRGQRTVLIDSDLLFISKPQEIVDWAQAATVVPFYNRDPKPTYRSVHVPPGAELPPHFNAGFIGFDGRFGMEELWRCCQNIDYWLEDQTVYTALLAGRGARALDRERYCVYTGEPLSPKTAMLHFISTNRFKSLLYPRLARVVYKDVTGMARG